VLQCVVSAESCCTLLQCVAVCCSVLQCYCGVLQYDAVCCSVLQYVVSAADSNDDEPHGATRCCSVCCSVLQCIAVCPIVFHCVA